MAYIVVACSIQRFAMKRRDFPFTGLFTFFAIVFGMCGLVHFSDVAVLWTPAYGVQGVFKLVAALVSVVTAAAVWQLVPKALALPSPESLQAEVVERRRAEQALMTAKETAESASRAKSEFLANMSHELRTPLNAIIGFADALGTGVFGPLNGRQCEYLRHVGDSGKHLLAIINDILDISRVDAGKMELHDEEVDVAEVIRGCASLLGDRAAKHGLTITVETPAILPRLWGDSLRLRQVILNLLSNAIKFTPDNGHIRMGAQNDSDGLTITVSDTGIGMAAADIPRALETFSQVDNTLSRRYEGTGLGLPLTLALVRLHDGTLSINSEPGCGTTVVLRFPGERLRPPAPLAG